MLTTFRKAYDAVQLKIGPELRRLPDPDDRFKTCERAWEKVLGWSGSFVVEGVYLIVFILSYGLSTVVLPGRAADDGAVWFVGAGFVVTTLVIVLVLRKRFRHALRVELARLGSPIWEQCGYDLTGNRSGVCSECGTSAPASSGNTQC